MIALGTAAPSFALPEPATSATVSLDELQGPALVVTFICNHCPYVQHVAAGLAELGRDLAQQGVAMVGISSNDVVTYPQDGPVEMVAEARPARLDVPLPLRRDPGRRPRLLRGLHPRHIRFRRRASARLPRPTRRLAPQNDLPVTGADIRAAVDAVLAGRNVDPDQRPSIGCGIKWR